MVRENQPGNTDQKPIWTSDQLKTLKNNFRQAIDPNKPDEGEHTLPRTIQPPSPQRYQAQFPMEEVMVGMASNRLGGTVCSFERVKKFMEFIRDSNVGFAFTAKPSSKFGEITINDQKSFDIFDRVIKREINSLNATTSQHPIRQ